MNTVSFYWLLIVVLQIIPLVNTNWVTGEWTIERNLTSTFGYIYLQVIFAGQCHVRMEVHVSDQRILIFVYVQLIIVELYVKNDSVFCFFLL